ncbi:MAG: hypothetical protein Q8N26_05710 [Myxococcales bacterium]|nr:hypothetical protein [Myxococcales bacterium]
MIRLRQPFSIAVLTLAATAAPAQAPGKDNTEQDRAAREAVRATSFTVPADAPRPPQDKLKKTQTGELKNSPAKKAIKDFEDKVFQLQKPENSIWSYLIVGEGNRVPPPSQRIVDTVASLQASLEAIKATDPSWARLAEYEQHAAFFESVVAAHRAYAEGVAVAKQEAATAAVAAVDGAWNAKRAKDDGMPHAFHSSNASKVVYANRVIGAAETAVDATTSVAADAPLFARAYFSESGWNAMHSSGVDCGETPSSPLRYKVFADVNGENRFDLGALDVDKATFQTATTLDLSRPGSLTAGGALKSEDERTTPFRWLTIVTPALRDGDNTVELEVRAWCTGAREVAGAPLARGSLTVKASKGSRGAVAARGTYAMAPSAHGGAELAGLRGKITRHFEGKGGTVVDFRTVSDWQPVRHPVTGALVARAATAFAVVQKKGTTFCELYSLGLEEPHDGARYGPALNLSQALARPFVCTIR